MASDQPSSKRLLFLSHSGNDTDYAARLRQAILAHPQAQHAGLNVWFDKEDLKVGERWSQGIEKGLAQSTAFAVVIGENGVLNWVGREVDDAIDRATTDESYLVIPIFAQTLENEMLEKVPRLLRQHQGVEDPLSNPENLDKLIAAILDTTVQRPKKVLEFPFVGLRAMTERDSARFFGRDQELAELIERFRQNRLIIIDADSGSGKSSLVNAGLVPKYRSGAFEDKDSTPNEANVWHVVNMRPQSDAWAGLRKGIHIAYQQLGKTLDIELQSKDPETIAYNLLCGLPIEQTRVLLVVDQFEEYFLQQRDYEQDKPDVFLDLLLYLSSAKCPVEVRVIATIRSDYFNLCRAYDPLKQRLESDQQSVFRLRSIIDDPEKQGQGLEAIIRQPLKLVNYDNADDINALVKAIRQDKRDRGSDLALIQMALEQCWNRLQKQQNTMLLQAYTEVGGISGVLAKAADEVKAKLTKNEQENLFSVFARLLQVNDTGGITRRTANLDEFDQDTRTLAQKLADEAHQRLLIASENDIEVSHEEIFRQWGWLVGQIQQHSTKLRDLNRLMERPDKNTENLDPASGVELEQYEKLKLSHPHWLSTEEQAFIDASIGVREELIEREKQRKKLDQRRFILITCLAVFASLAGGFSFYQLEKAKESERQAIEAKTLSDRNRSQALLALAQTAITNLDYADAAKLVLATGVSHNENLAFAETAEQLAQRLKFKLPNLYLNPDVDAQGANWNKQKSQISTWGRDRGQQNQIVQVWEAKTGQQISEIRPDYKIKHVAFNSKGSLILTRGDTRTGLVQVWEAQTGRLISEIRSDERIVHTAWSSDGSLLLTQSILFRDGFIQVWEAKTGQLISEIRLDKQIAEATWGSNGSLLLIQSRLIRDGLVVEVWEAKTGHLISTIRSPKIERVAWNSDGSLLLTQSTVFRDGVVEVWKPETGQRFHEIRMSNFFDLHITWNSDGSLILFKLDDNNIQVWETNSGNLVSKIKFDKQLSEVRWIGDGSLILTRSRNNDIEVWDARTGKLVSEYRGGSAFLDSVWNENQSQFLTKSHDNTVQIWEVKTGEPVTQMEHASKIKIAQWFNEGSQILTIPEQGPARLWNLDIPEVDDFDFLCWRLGDNTSLADIEAKYELTDLPPICQGSPE